MTMGNATEKEARRTAYALYVECFWSLRRLPPGDACRPALAQATQQAESAWRALMARTMGNARPGCAPQSGAHGRAHPVALRLPRDARSSGESPPAGER